jgi:hypothetical protein
MSENSPLPEPDDDAVRQLLELQLKGLHGDDPLITEEATAGLAAYIRGYNTSQPEEEQALAGTPRGRLQAALEVQRVAYQVKDPVQREHAVEQANEAVWTTWREFLAGGLE